MKRAFIVGINYVGTPNELRGCVNDAKNMETMLEARGFEVELCLDEDATTEGIKEGLIRLVDGAAPGDVLVFHYSGHGSQLPSKVEADGYEEIICPVDLDWYTKVITDDQLRTIFNTVPAGVNTTVILDSCHSGTALDQLESYDTGIRSEILAEEKAVGEKRFMNPPAHIAAELENRKSVQWTASRDVNTTALLIAGCRAEQTSADAAINGVPQGACTYALLKTMREFPQSTYAELITKMDQYMAKNGYEQRPELDGSSALYNKEFLAPFTDAVETEPALTPEPTPVPPVVVPVQSKPTFVQNFIGLILAALGAALAFFFLK